MTKQINEHILRLTGKVELEEPMVFGSDYTLTISGQIVKTEDMDNQDGTFNRIYTFKSLILQDNGTE